MATQLTTNITFPIFLYCKDKICIDIGANTGGMTDSMLHNGALKVYSFEAGNKMCIALRNKFKDFNNVIIEEYAVSNEQSILENVTWINAWLLGTPENMGLPVSPGACDIEGYNLVSIPTISIDYYFKSKTIDEKIGFIKIDVDGYEFKVLKGAYNTIMRDRPIIMIELSFYIDKVQGSSVKEFLELIDAMDYKFITADGYLCDMEFIKKEYPWHSSCDVFLIPNELYNDPEILKNTKGNKI